MASSTDFKEDSDLMFLQFCDNDDLSILVDILKGKSGEERLTEGLTGNERFKKCSPDNYKEVWDVIAAELQKFGGDSMVNMFRSHGVLYREILTDVCEKLKVNFNTKGDILLIETNLMMKILEKSLEQMSAEEREELSKQFGLGIHNFAPSAVMIAMQAAIKIGGFKAYQLALIVANEVAKALVGRGLAFAANASLMRGLAVFAGPVGWAISALLTIPTLTGPAYRVTIPACIQVAYMRQKSMTKDHF